MEGSGGRDIALHRCTVESVMPHILSRDYKRSGSIFESARPQGQLSDKNKFGMKRPELAKGGS